MKMTFWGASGTVTGSCYLLETSSITVLVDCGMFQGEEEIERRNWEAWEFNPARVDVVLLTHAHLDHCGLLPKLVRQGFHGRILATAATRDLTKIILEDAARLQEEDEKHGRLPDNQKALYRQVDIDKVMELFETQEISEMISLNSDFKFRMRNSGHILGAVSFEIWFKNKGGQERKIVFSGDLGQPGERIIKDPDLIREADYIVVESTYGGRLHKDKSATLVELLAIINDLTKSKGQGVIPTFAVERAQEILYELNLFVEKGLLKELKVFLDSPMAIKATEVFRQYKDLYDTDALDLLQQGDDPFQFPGLSFTETTDQSKALVNAGGGSIIMAGSGMCTGGRVIHHLLRELPNPNSHVIFVGFQAPGTLGRLIVDKVSPLKIWGHEIVPKAKIHTLGGFSAHGDQHDLMYWVGGFGSHPKQVIITHGDDENRDALSAKIKTELNLTTYLPQHKDSIELD